MKFIEKIKINFMLKLLEKQRKKYKKHLITGERFIVPRNNLKGVETILYQPQTTGLNSLPVLFNLHGGAWVGGDAVLMDTFCRLMADNLKALIVNVNYTKLDVHPFPYPEIELCDTVLYFAKHAEQYGINEMKFVIGGHSAGAHIAAGTALRLKEVEFNLAGQLLIYPFLDFTLGLDENEPIKEDSEIIKFMDLFRKMFFDEVGINHRWISPLLATDGELTGIAPMIMITAGKDELTPRAIAYKNRLVKLGIKVIHKNYPEAEHGFLEFSQPEYKGDKRRAPEQFTMAKDCEQYLIRELSALFN